ncbi:rod shape-determining protein MreD [Bacillus testis]|uniref:rod shape-determining protein MreD n=1 Tax=Bacillus testis TaxID=1622072 RepID=UPI00067F43D1|nr:rod shape-determining protein MreD [Bacillus testis]
MRKFAIPLAAALIFIVESVFVSIFSGNLFNSDWIVVPRFIMIFLVFFAVYGKYWPALWYGMVLGLVYDITYTEILGIYLFMYPIVTYMISKTMKILQNNLLIVSIMSLFSIVMLEFIVYGFNLILGFTDFTVQEFLAIRLLPTLLLNAIVLLVAAYPLKQLFLKNATEDSGGDTLFMK